MTQTSTVTKITRQYQCATCNTPLTGKGEGLKTFTCPKHPVRFVTVQRDTSGGLEQTKDRRREPTTVKRHTLVKVVHLKQVDN